MKFRKDWYREGPREEHKWKGEKQESKRADAWGSEEGS